MPLSPSVLPARHPLRRAINTLLIASLAGVAIVIFAAAWAGPDYRIPSEDVARATANQYAFEAYTQWSMRTGRACPDNLWTLVQYMNHKDTRDPWGTEYAMHCGAVTPSGSPGIIVVSAGADERFGTDDDVRSDR